MENIGRCTHTHNHTQISYVNISYVNCQFTLKPDQKDAALKAPLRALETHSGGLGKTCLFQKCHQSVSLDL